MYMETDSSTAPAVSHSDSHKIQTTWRTRLIFQSWDDWRSLKRQNSWDQHRSRSHPHTIWGFTTNTAVQIDQQLQNCNIQTNQERVFWGITTILLETVFLVWYVLHQFCVRYITENDRTLHSFSRKESRLTPPKSKIMDGECVGNYSKE